MALTDWHRLMEHLPQPSPEVLQGANCSTQTQVSPRQASNPLSQPGAKNTPHSLFRFPCPGRDSDWNPTATAQRAASPPGKEARPSLWALMPSAAPCPVLGGQGWRAQLNNHTYRTQAAATVGTRLWEGDVTRFQALALVLCASVSGAPQAGCVCCPCVCWVTCSPLLSQSHDKGRALPLCGAREQGARGWGPIPAPVKPWESAVR